MKPSRWLWIGACALAAGLLVGPFKLVPAGFWGAAAGLLGAAVGLCAARVGESERLRKRPAGRLLLQAMVVLGGGFALWMAASFRFVWEWVEATAGF